MKNKLIITFTLIIVVASCKSTNNNDKTEYIHNSQNSLDWQGTYIATLPCYDCLRIEKSLKLDSSQCYELRSEYIGSNKPLITLYKGQFVWRKNGSIIELINKDNTFGTMRYKVGENYLILLGKDSTRFNKIVDE